MLSHKLIDLIERNSGQITRRMLEDVRKDPLLPVFGKLSDSELTRRFANVCEKLGSWLLSSDEYRLAHRYGNLGRERFQEGIPLHEVIHAAHLFKNSLLEYAREQRLEQTALEVYADQELEHLIGGFFDRVVYHLVKGYEQALLEAGSRYVKSQTGR